MIGYGGIGRKLHVAPSEGSITESQVKHGAATFEAKEAFFELNASGLGGGEDEVGEVLRFAHVFRCFSGFRNSPRSSICFGSLMMRSSRSLPVSG